MRIPPRFAGLLALLLIVAAPRGFGQAQTLPDLGSAGDATLSPVLERRLGESIMRDIRFREPTYVDDPETTTRDTERGPWSVSAAIQNPPRIPVLADGLFVHATRPTGPMDPFETDVQLPNISCKKCTLQVVQFMADHGFNNPGGYSYHHCAELQITADPAKPVDTGWPAER